MIDRPRNEIAIAKIHHPTEIGDQIRSRRIVAEPDPNPTDPSRAAYTRVTSVMQRTALLFSLAAASGLVLLHQPPSLLRAPRSRLLVADSSYEVDPAAFCAAARGGAGATAALATNAFGGCTLVGDEAGLALARDSSPVAVREPGALVAPFALCTDGEASFSAMQQTFSAESYAEIFGWIPRYKEAGFSTFRFEDFLDGRVRKLVGSVRLLLLRTASPRLFGAPLGEAAAALSFGSGDELAQAYAAHATWLRAASRGGLLGMVPPSLSLPSLAALATGGTPGSALEPMLDAWVKRGGPAHASSCVGGADGFEALLGLTSSVEQTTALVCNMIAAAEREPRLSARLAAEQEAALKGSRPDAPISLALLEAMPELGAFSLETLRLHPPGRPRRSVLGTPATLDGATLAAGSQLAPEPFLAHFDPAVYTRPLEFDPGRYARGEPAPCCAFGGEVGERGGGARLAVLLAQATFVQLRRMFSELTLGASPPPKPAGFPVHTLPEGCEVRAVPRMFYEIQRGVKKLRF